MTTQELYEFIKQNFDNIQHQFEDVNKRLGTLETDVAWMKGTLEGDPQEGKASVWQIVTTATAVGAVIIALIALLK